MTRADLHDYINWLRTRLVVVPGGPRAEAALRLELASALAERYESADPEEQAEAAADLDEVIDCTEWAVRALDPGDEGHADALSFAGQARAERYRLGGAAADRDAAIEHLRTWLRSVPGDPDGGEPLADLAALLLDRYEERTAGDEDVPRAELDVVIDHCARARRMAGDSEDGDALRLWLDYLHGMALAFRFDHRYFAFADAFDAFDAPDDGQIALARADRDAAIDLLTRLRAAMESGEHADEATLSIVTGRLGELHWDRRTDPWPDAPEPDDGDADRAVELLGRVADAPGALPGTIGYLADALRGRFEARGAEDDRLAAIARFEQLLDGAGEATAAHAHEMLGDLHFAGADRDPPPDGRREGFTAAIEHYGAALAAARDDARGLFAGLLAYTYWKRADGAATDDDLDRIAEHAGEAWERLEPGEGRTLGGLMLGVALHDRLPRSRRGRAADLADIERAAAVLTEVEPDWRDDPDTCSTVAAMIGVLLTARGQATSNAADLRAAGPWLTRALETLPVGTRPGDVIVRNVAIGLMTRSAYDMSSADTATAIGLLRAALDDPRSGQREWTRAALGIMLCQNDAGLAEGIGHLEAAYRELPPDDRDRITVAEALAGALTRRFNESRDLEDTRAAEHYREIVVEYFRRAGAGEDHFSPDAPALLRAGQAGLAIARGAFGGGDELVGRGVAEMRAALDSLPESHPHRARMRAELGTGMIMHGLTGRGGGTVALLEAADHLSAGLAEQPPGHPARPYTLLRAASGHLLIAMGTQDRTAAKEAMRIADLGLDERAGDANVLVRLGFFAAAARYALGGLTRDPGWYAEAASRLEGLLADPGVRPNPDIEAGMRMLLAMTRREEGHHDAAREAGLAALRAHGKAVLLQTGTGQALARARAVYPQAEQIADWHVRDGDLGGAVTALELGRGLVLHAATSAADVPSLLADAGHGPLAAEWRAAPGAYGTRPWERGQDLAELLTSQGGLVVPSELGRRALAALAGGSAETRLLNPPSTADIARALAATGADALVYLQPPVPGRAGTGIVVTADGRLLPLSMPLLMDEYSGILDEYIDAGNAVQTMTPEELADRDPTASNRWRRALDALCNWAHTAVMRPLLGLCADQWRGREPRLVLVPVGRLSVVPWHAARRRPREEGPPRYACADAVISYAVSGRQLVDVAQRPVRPVGDDPLIVSDTSGTLYYAPIECKEIRRHFFPGARLLGDEGLTERSGDGTPDEVLEGFPAAGRPGASDVHLACHAFAREEPTAAFFHLAGGQPLTIERILRTARGRDPAAPGGRVTAAACVSDLAVSDYDEALTLSTAILAAGPVTAVGSRWKIPDRAASLLMFVYYRHLHRGLSPRDALRAAQLWMLDPSREAPEGMADELLLAMEEVEDDPDGPLYDVYSWAAYTHQGR
ncbi:CHAT domain-containing protein [Actinomadura geliboluensis]|uniref:CHAT domain-containing protein n=1 Tax=Actinomadura geliboluensis TaxID=882440 RepID=UPI00371B6E1F